MTKKGEAMIVPDGSHFSPLINGLRAGVTGDFATTRHRPAALCQKETTDV